MTPKEFLEARLAAGLSQSEMARALGVSTRQVRRYQAGESAVSRPVAEMARGMKASSDPFRNAASAMERAAIAAEKENHPVAGLLRELATKAEEIIRSMNR